MWNGQTSGEILSARANYRVEGSWCGSFLGLVLFRLVAPSLQLGVLGPSPSTGCMVSQPFAVRGNLSYPEFWAVTGVPRYFTSTVALEPSIERVVGAGHSAVGRAGSHMLL
jgi:hypothetical protein